MSWHYMPVYTEYDNERFYSICEVYLDENDKLNTWTEKNDIAATGSDMDDLAASVILMLHDVVRWKPVAFNHLKVGMVFEAAELDGYSPLLHALEHHLLPWQSKRHHE